jgi:hypothetical protein
MPTKASKKTTTRKMARRPPKGTDDRIIVVETKQVPTDSLQGYYKNPRVGDIDAIAISLDQNGQYRPILVNIGTLTGRENEILAGNHTWMAARRELTYRDGEGNQCFKEAYPLIYASFIDVDEDTAKKIVLADNKTADGGSYEESILAELFASLPDVTGTGYTKDEVDDILSGLDEMVAQSTANIDDFLKDMPVTDDEDEDETPRVSARQQVLDNESEEKRDAARARGATRIEETEEDKDIEDIDVSAELQVVLELKEDNVYKGENKWGIPELRMDMIAEDFPSDSIKTWGGNEATPDDGKQWWLYQYSLGGRKGLPIDRSIMCFFTHDAKFANWWELPAYYTARYMSEGLKYIVVPDYSFYYTETRAHHMWSVYKAQWMGRFFQEAGLKVIPRFQCDYMDPDSLEIGLLGIPKGTPTLAMSMQNIEDEKVQGPKLEKHLIGALEALEPGKVLYYSGNPGKRVMESAMKKTGWDGEVQFVENYAAVRRATVFDKKEGKAKLTRKQKEAIVEKHGGKKKGKKEQDIDYDEVE